MRLGKLSSAQVGFVCRVYLDTLNWNAVDFSNRLYRFRFQALCVSYYLPV